MSQRTKVRKGEAHAPNAMTGKSWQGRSEGTKPKRSGRARAPDSPSSSDGRGESHATNATKGRSGRTVSEAGCAATRPNGSTRRRKLHREEIYDRVQAEKAQQIK